MKFNEDFSATLRQAAQRSGFGDVRCVGLWRQLRARLARASDPNSGEECLLRARKP